MSFKSQVSGKGGGGGHSYGVQEQLYCVVRTTVADSELAGDGSKNHKTHSRLLRPGDLFSIFFRRRKRSSKVWKDGFCCFLTGFREPNKTTFIPVREGCTIQLDQKQLAESFMVITSKKNLVFRAFLKHNIWDRTDELDFKRSIPVLFSKKRVSLVLFTIFVGATCFDQPKC